SSPTVLSSCRSVSRSRPTTEVARQSTAAPRRGRGGGGDDGGDDQREPGGARAAGARRPPRARGARRARRLRYGAGHQGPGAPLLAGAAQRALPGVRLRRREARPHPVRTPARMCCSSFLLIVRVPNCQISRGWD
uniref:Uncharacterized protein n=1 Tax=Triticum urartu TaxID=4572 RepID=A0A8R7UP67_TRIUA